MAGNTGKMTRAAIRERGPRMILTEIRVDGRSLGFVIRRDGQWCFNPLAARVKFGDGVKTFTWSRSYTLGYLLRAVPRMVPEVSK